MTDKQGIGARAVFGAVGDVVLSGAAAAELQTRGTGWLFEEVLPILRRADVLFGNLECVLLPPDFPVEKLDPRGLTTSVDGTAALQQAGFGVLSLANNHILDGGTSGLTHTRRAVEARGMLACGVSEAQEAAGRLHVLERAGLTWGFLCYAEDSNYTLSTRGPGPAYYEPASVLEDIARSRPEVDVLVVSVHADLEFVETPAVRRRDDFREFARAGATLVLGHHPHVPQGVERLGSSLIAYSLGNFAVPVHTSAYLSPHLPTTAQTFVLLVDVSRAGVLDFERVPVLIARSPGQRPVPAGGEEADALNAYLAELDGLVVDDERVAANWRAAAVGQLVLSIERAAALDDPDEVLHMVGRLLYVAENRAWADEVAAAAAEIWEEQRLQVDAHRRPGFAVRQFGRSARRPLAVRAAARLRRALAVRASRRGAR
jgi:poly-gamma-glutamate capsule biosynthesis protein CapA/YwtB (metallophosphatase superfamily)